MWYQCDHDLRRIANKQKKKKIKFARQLILACRRPDDLVYNVLLSSF